MNFGAVWSIIIRLSDKKQNTLHKRCCFFCFITNAQWVSRWTLPKSLSFAPSYPFYSFYHPHRYSKDTFSTILKNSSPFNSEVHSTVQLRLPVIRKLPYYKTTNYSQSCFQFIYAKMISKHEM